MAQEPGRSRRLRWSALLVRALVAAAIAFLPFALLIHNFLAINQPVGQGVLVVEAWIPEATLAASVRTYESGSYRYLVVVGSPTTPTEPTTTAARAAAYLTSRGFDGHKIVQIDEPFHRWNRTAATAQAFKKWLKQAPEPIRSVDVYTVGVHARKSWVLFRGVLGDGYQVGVVSGPEVAYNPDLWIGSRTGIWLVFRNFAGYVYAKLWVLLN